jgi:hypothetical protein
VYGFTDSADAVEIEVSGISGEGNAIEYKVSATVSRSHDNSGCNSTHCIDPKTPLPPAHGAWTFLAVLKSEAAAGGMFNITASSTSKGPNSTIDLQEVTYGGERYLIL